jgi:RsiW-degrading membrane proteinase PrsW (M82 family)
MEAIDQWYYLDGSETRGPVPSGQIAQLIRNGSLSPTTQVAQAGWQTWSPASVALSHLLGGQQQKPVAAVEPPTYAIKVQCVSGPDAGKAYMISAAEVSLGRVSGIGQQDSQVAENHVVLSWQNNVLYFRTFAGSKLRVAGADVTQGTLSNGQQFQLGASTWQVGSTPVELTNLLSNLGSRLNKLTSTDKLEGFSLAELFSEVFKGRKPGEIDEYFAIGTARTTPALEDVKTGWPKPWFFMRVLIFMAGVYFVFYKLLDVFGLSGGRTLPGLTVIGSLVIPLAMVFLFWELNAPRNVSFPMVLILVCLGGAASMFVAFIGFDIANLDWLGASSAGIIEETGKLLAVVLVVRNLKYKYILNGILFGAAIGAGFSAFETAGYALMDGFFDGFLRAQLSQMLDAIKKDEFGQFVEGFRAYVSGTGLPRWFAAAVFNGHDDMLTLLHRRAYLTPFGGHIVWTAIAAGALWRVKQDQPFRLNMLFDPLFLRTFSIPVLLHMIWNSPLLRFEGLLGLAKYIVLGVIAWYVAFLLVQQGLRQIRDMQVSHTQTEYQRTQEILTTTGRFRSQQAVQ